MARNKLQQRTKQYNDTASISEPTNHTDNKSFKTAATDLHLKS